MALFFALALGVTLLGLALRTEEQRRLAPPLPPPSSLSGGEVTLLLPVRDEESNVLPCLDTLLAQTARPRVRVIDDGSTDATVLRVRGVAERDGALTLLDAGPLPPGWRGKVHALWAGSRTVTTPWLLLTDADARLAPDLLARALAAADAGGLDAVSLAGRQEARGAVENLLVPPVFALLDVLLGDWRSAAAGGGPAVASGQFLLLRREPWEACGGFEAIRSETLDDVAAVIRLRERGSRTAFFREPGLRVRMYRGAREVIRGWRRNLGGLFGRRPGLTLAVLAILTVPPLALLALSLAGRWVETVLVWAAGAAASAVFRASSDNEPAWGMLYPLDALLLAAVLALGVIDRRRGRLASWKGREIRV
jgi:cellulose synthase/poly-beta-1,6-N-acetylglucosamine synthase-like glycosyltransferase